MYKRLTHTIVEEHFDSPSDGDVRASLERFGMPIQPLSPQQFRDIVNGYFTTFDGRINQLLSSIPQPFDTSQLETELFADIDFLGNFLSQYYAPIFGEKFNVGMRTIGIVGVNLSTLGRNNLDTTFQRNRSGSIASEFAGLSSWNNAWTWQTIFDLVTQWVTAYVDQSDALAMKNVTAADQARTRSTQAMMTFANALVDGTIQKHPDLFPV